MDKERFDEAFNRYYDRPFIFQNNQDFYTVCSEILLDGIPLIVHFEGVVRKSLKNSLGKIMEFLKEGGSTLDVGCGYGQRTKYIALENPKSGVIGLDINKGVINLANRRRINNLTYLIGDVFALPFKNEIFDSVLYCNAIQESGRMSCDGTWYEYYLEEKIGELARVTKKNGEIFVTHNGFEGFEDEVNEAIQNSNFKLIASHKFERKCGEEDSMGHLVISKKL